MIRGSEGKKVRRFKRKENSEVQRLRRNLEAQRLFVGNVFPK